MNIPAIKHPTYRSQEALWEKWRLTYEGGDEFIEKYMIKFSIREQAVDFTNRKKFSYCPAFAKAAVDTIKNSIFQRVADITRDGGPQSWMQACQGKLKGVDLKGSTMNNFIGRELLVEMLTMKKVGVYIDRQPLSQPLTKADVVGHPYLYLYKVENILSWKYGAIPGELDTVLLRDVKEKLDPDTGLPVAGDITEYRLLQLNSDGVAVTIYDNKNEIISTTTLRLPKIPFVIFEITDSLLRDVCNYQIALLNMESSDIAFCLKGNYPFYTEQDSGLTSNHLKKKGTKDQNDDDVNDSDVEVGAHHGRRYPKGADRPEFIAPPVDPLMASIKKQGEIKADIRMLVNLSLADIKPKMASAESKTFDERGLEAGLSAIGMELEHGERLVAEMWAIYEGDRTTQPTVIYPKRYSLPTDSAVLSKAEKLEDRMKALPSDTYKREVAKQVADLMVGSAVSLEILKKIHQEIDDAKILNTEPALIEMMIEKALLSQETASKALGAPDGEVEQAKKDAAERAANILKLQQKNSPGSRGAQDLDTDPNAADNEKAGAQSKELK